MDGGNVKIQWASVTSSNIEALGLDQHNRLAARFKGGRAYIYDGDHSETYTTLMAENQRVESNPGDDRFSVGRMFNTLVKSAGYDYAPLPSTGV